MLFQAVVAAFPIPLPIQLAAPPKALPMFDKNLFPPPVIVVEDCAASNFV